MLLGTDSAKLLTDEPQTKKFLLRPFLADSGHAGRGRSQPKHNHPEPTGVDPGRLGAGVISANSGA